jgi:hypothetical protein
MHKKSLFRLEVPKKLPTQRREDAKDAKEEKRAFPLRCLPLGVFALETSYLTRATTPCKTQKKRNICVETALLTDALTQGAFNGQ